MDSESDFWREIEPLVRREGLELFDIEAPKGRGGFLRIYIARGKNTNLRPGATQESDSSSESSSGVNISDCAKISREILSLSDIERYMPGDTKLEVSSPGVNRKLRRPSHFSGAVGERVRIGYTDSEGAKKVAHGLLVRFEADVLCVNDEESGEVREFPLQAVRDARVDFKF